MPKKIDKEKKEQKLKELNRQIYISWVSVGDIYELKIMQETRQREIRTTHAFRQW